MTMFVSSRSLPLAGIHSLALLFYRSKHFLGRNAVFEVASDRDALTLEPILGGDL